MTHGEIYVHRRMNLDFTHDIDKILRQLEKLPPRMNRHDALKHYGDKLRFYFGTAKDESPKDFLKIDDYFDYHDAERILNALHR